MALSSNVLENRVLGENSKRAQNNQNIINLQSIFYTDNGVVVLSTAPLLHEQRQHQQQQPDEQ